MQDSNYKITNISLRFIYLLINALFITKYLVRISISVAIVVCLLYIAFFYVISHFLHLKKNISNKHLLLAISVFCIIFITIQYAINPYQIQVDRWSAIHNFINYLVHGKYPYMAQTHLGGYGSPFPCWQFIHIPFYYLNNVGLSMFFMLGFVVYSIKKLYDNNTAFYFLLLLVYSPAFLYEIIVRSDLIANFLFVLGIINLLLAQRIELKSHCFAYSVFLGLTLSTRLSVSVPFFILLFPAFINLPNKKKITLLGGIMGIFCLTFLPFIYWDVDKLLFFEYNPFILQTRQGSILELIILIPIFTYLSLSWKKDKYQLTRNIGYSLFTLVTITFLINMIRYNNYHLYSSIYDISYFNMSLPFIILSLIISNEEKNYKL